MDGDRLAAAVYTWLTFRLVRAQNEPKVIVFTHYDHDQPTLLIIRIANIGRDIATDVCFSASRPIPVHAYGLSVESAREEAAKGGKQAEFLSNGPLVDGIPALGPGDVRDIVWGQYGGLMHAVGAEPIEMRFSYRHGRRRLRGVGLLDVRSYTSTGGAESRAAAIADSVEDVATAAKVIAVEAKEIRQLLRHEGTAR